MSIRRIESSYATFLEDRKMSAAEMSVLVALAYVANEKRDEDCYPSDRYLKLLTHLGDRTIRSARNNLRSRKIIDWVSGGMGRQGGNISNRYRFLFPLFVGNICQRHQNGHLRGGHLLVVQEGRVGTLNPADAHFAPFLPFASSPFVATAKFFASSLRKVSQSFRQV